MSRKKKEKRNKQGHKKADPQILKSVTAVICTLAVSVSALSCVEKVCEAKIEKAKVCPGEYVPAGGITAAIAGTGGDYLSAESLMHVNGDTAFDTDGSTSSASVGVQNPENSAVNGNKTGGTEKYNGPLLFMNVVPFDFSKHDPDPSKWTVQEIVDCYKAGMARADNPDVQTDQSFELVGDLPGASALKKPINLAMKLGAQPYNALTGGYWDLQASDLKKADAHKEGNYVVINLYPKEQVDGPNGKEHEGTVGHVCNVVQGIGDFIAYVEENYAVLNAQYEDDSIILKYPDAYAKNVKINTKTGKMESGTWGYDVDVYLDHCSLLNIKFNNFHTTIRWKCWYPVAD